MQLEPLARRPRSVQANVALIGPVTDDVSFQMVKEKEESTAAKKAKVEASRAAKERKRHDATMNAKQTAVAAFCRIADKDECDWRMMTVPELKAVLTVVQADIRGNKQALIDRCSAPGMAEQIKERLLAGEAAAAEGEDSDASEGSGSDEGDGESEDDD